MSRVTRRVRTTRYAVGAPPRVREDHVAAEEPLQIRLRSWAGEHRDLTVTMRTPGDDFDLVAGFLVGEGMIRSADDLATMRYCAGTDESGEQTFNVIDATLAAGVALPPSRVERQVTTTSACGICGTTSIEDVLTAAPGWPPDPTTVPADLLFGLPDRLRVEQSLFERTGGVHAAGLFRVGEIGDGTGEDSDLLCVREDVGRHNAVDKVIGWALREERLPLTGTVLQVSGRASFELVQKAWQGGIPVLAAVGAPSSLAVDLATEAGLTLIGFSRGASFNVYTHPERVSN
ncbi:MAG TPA: formate dehydrogenase accessory sulfurtransferase FdhD [Dermatophilaceae bacterium]|nr:formate dehydrogenase accessory sulfurtransferase FdhD [Dermatophilaceae bacterium]HOR17000.1 formate dehydrogenase accessory sulfurtransferase FdhD [Dermatophilaceae bacterium]HOV02407.1 formate dehydrogenase accessory sulfurtransferase FdhD [Dermatophilaceae bacterium]HPK90569.1 formate dehydrogenase accessory sulfurtransferase FdhD [Dermatophilaceae bacterium]HQG12242.1 formate dehydrogenase accessory sulfurtransferase FdhD [Dermatophilaceae bacterium]